MPVVRTLDPGRREEILRQVNELAVLLKDSLGALAVYLHGSLAVGTMHEGSDIDLVVVANLPGSMVERIARVLELTDLPVEPLVYTPQEFTSLAAAHNPLIERVLEHGKQLI